MFDVSETVKSAEIFLMKPFEGVKWIFVEMNIALKRTPALILNLQERCAIPIGWS